MKDAGSDVKVIVETQIAAGKTLKRELRAPFWEVRERAI